MSADLLREAAALMRARAEVATSGPWSRAVVDGMGHAVHRGEHTTISLYSQRQDAEHIASWHPAVALAVADWLDAKAEQDDKGTCDDPRGCCNLCEHDYGHVAALAVARAYLGRADA